MVLRSGLFLISFCIIPTPCSLLIWFYSSIFLYLPPQAHFQCSFKFHCVSCITLICNSNSIFSFTPSLSLFSSSRIRYHSAFKTLYNTILLFHSIIQWSRSNDHSTIHKSPDCQHIWTSNHHTHSQPIQSNIMHPMSILCVSPTVATVPYHPSTHLDRSLFPTTRLNVPHSIPFHSISPTFHP